MKDSLKALIFHRNRGVILGFEFLFGVGVPLLAVMTLLPGFFRHLGVAHVWIGVLPALQTTCIALMHVVSTYLIPADEKRLSRVRAIYALSGIAFVLLGVLILNGLHAPAPTLIATLLTVTVFALAIGSSDPHYLDFVVAAIDPAQRGRYFGMRFMAFGLGGIAGGALAARVLRAFPAPLNFGWSFCIGGAIYVFATLLLRFYRSDGVLALRHEAARDGDFKTFLFERLGSWLRHHEFRWFLIASSFFIFAAGGFPFLSLLLKTKLNESDRVFGLLGSLFMGSNLAAAWALGFLTDRWGARRSFAFAIGLYGVGVLGCLLFEGRGLLLLSYFLASSWFPAQYITGVELSLRIARGLPASQATAIKMVSLAPAQILGPIVIGAALDHWSYERVLTACLVCLVLALLALCRCVPVLSPAPVVP